MALDTLGMVQLTIGIVLLLIFVVGCFMYIIIMGPSRYHRNGIVGRMHEVLMQVPATVCGCLCCVLTCSNREHGEEKWSRFSQQTFHERNWLMVAFYIGLVWTAEFLYLFIHMPRVEFSLPSKAVSWALVLLSEYLYLRAVFADPGVVTPEEALEEQQRRPSAQPAGRNKHKTGRGGKNRKPNKRGVNNEAAEKEKKNASFQVDPTTKAAPRASPFTAVDEYVLNRRYVVDGMLYAQAGADHSVRHCAEEAKYTNDSGAKIGFPQACMTCHVPRPARSRHCRLCNSCVRRFDHHCPWINNDVAEGTHRYFLGFLFMHALSCTWGLWDLLASIKQFLVQFRAWGWVLRMHNGAVYRLTVIDYVAIIVNYQMLPACLAFFAFCIGLVLYGFWGYQMTYVIANLTMNDMNKIDDVVHFIYNLPSLELVYRESVRVRGRLEEIAARKPTALWKLEEPPLPLTVKGYDNAGKMNKVYRRKARKMLLHDLKGLYDRGIVQNVLEVLFPYSQAEFKRRRPTVDAYFDVSAAKKATAAAASE